jgi:hypothetical protein
MKLKRLPLSLSLCLAFFFSGCASFDSQLPEGKAAAFRYVRTGKFSSTTIEAKNFEKTATHVRADTWNVKHSNAWVPNVEITAEGYERQLAGK